jgi:hypothetical protein
VPAVGIDSSEESAAVKAELGAPLNEPWQSCARKASELAAFNELLGDRTWGPKVALEG